MEEVGGGGGSGVRQTGGGGTRGLILSLPSSPPPLSSPLSHTSPLSFSVIPFILLSPLIPHHSPLTGRTGAGFIRVW